MWNISRRLSITTAILHLLDRLYVKRKEGGRGLVQVEVAYKAEMISIAEYLNTKYNCTTE